MERELLTLIGQLGGVGGLAFVVWKSLQAHAVKVEGFMGGQLKELTMLRAEVRTLIEVLSNDSPRPGRRFRTSPMGIPTPSED